MSGSWTSERVLGLAPDAASATAGRGQAKAGKWPLLGQSDVALWGEVQGSGKNPYQVRVDLREPAFKCSCPSRKFPCKHSLGLLLLFAEQPGQLPPGEPPEWVTEWLQSRAARKEKQQAKAEAQAAKPVDAAAQAKRVAAREKKVQGGVEQLQGLLQDIVRQGFAWAQTQSYHDWSSAAARLVDAQAPGLARMVAQLGEIAASGAGWQNRFLRKVARLHLAAEGYGRLSVLPEGTQADLRALIGWTTPREQLLQLPRVSGDWCVAGQQVDQEDRLSVQRTWLVRQGDGRAALLLDFAAGGQTFETLLSPGVAVPAELVFYPGAKPLRAVIASREDEQIASRWPGLASAEAVMQEFADTLSLNPWVESWPVTLQDVKLAPPREESRAWRLLDSEGCQLPMAATSRQGWAMLSVSAGERVSVFGEFDGDHLKPLGMWHANHYYALPQGRQGLPVARVA